MQVEKKIIDLSLALQRTEIAVKALTDRVVHLDLRMDHVNHNMGFGYENPSLANSLKTNVNLLLEDTVDTTFSDPQVENYGEMLQLITAEVHQDPVEIIVQPPAEPPKGTNQPPPLPK